MTLCVIQYANHLLLCVLLFCPHIDAGHDVDPAVVATFSKDTSVVDPLFLQVFSLPASSLINPRSVWTQQGEPLLLSPGLPPLAVMHLNGEQYAVAYPHGILFVNYSMSELAKTEGEVLGAAYYTNQEGGHFCVATLLITPKMKTLTLIIYDHSGAVLTPRGRVVLQDDQEILTYSVMAEANRCVVISGEAAAIVDVSSSTPTILDRTEEDFLGGSLTPHGVVGVSRWEVFGYSLRLGEAVFSSVVDTTQEGMPRGVAQKLLHNGDLLVYTATAYGLQEYLIPEGTEDVHKERTWTGWQLPIAATTLWCPSEEEAGGLQIVVLCHNEGVFVVDVGGEDIVLVQRSVEKCEAMQIKGGKVAVVSAETTLQPIPKEGGESPGEDDTEDKTEDRNMVSMHPERPNETPIPPISTPNPTKPDVVKPEVAPAADGGAGGISTISIIIVVSLGFCSLLAGLAGIACFLNLPDKDVEDLEEVPSETEIGERNVHYELFSKNALDKPAV